MGQFCKIWIKAARGWSGISKLILHPRAAVPSLNGQSPPKEGNFGLSTMPAGHNFLWM
jgi:hypothetical protein